MKSRGFEKLLADLSTKFVSLHSEQIDEEIENGLRRIVEFLNTDRSAIAEVRGDQIIITHVYARPDFPTHKRFSISAVPWFARKLLAGESVIFGCLPDDLPPEAVAEAEYCRATGLSAIATVPIFVAGKFFGVISTGSFRFTRQWPDQLEKRLKLFGEIFANALIRKRSEQEIKNQIAKLENQYQFERLISDLSAQFVSTSRTNLDDQIENSLERLLQFFQMDRMALLKIQEQRVATVTHSANAQGIAAAPVDINYIDYFPWHTKKLLAGEIISLHVKDLPEEAELDRKSAESIGIRSNLVIPLLVNDVVEYVFAANAIRSERTFDPELIPRIRLLGEIFANALMRRTIVEQRRQAELEAQRNRQELAHISRVTAAGELSASIAHELNQPLTGILSNAQAALRFLSAGSSVDLQEIKEILTDIVDDNKRAGEVIRKLRSMVKKGETEFVLLDVNALVSDVLELIRSDVLIRNVTVSVAPTEGLPRVRGDRIQLQQVLLNLLLNALDALTEVPVERRKVIVRITQLKNEVILISVTDYGKGISDAYHEKIFEPFFSTKKEGMGMGLSIAKTILNAHGGDLCAENNRDYGATFCFTLPVFATDAGVS